MTTAHTNQATLDVIEFLTHAGLGFGTESGDGKLLEHPANLREAVRLRLENPPDFLDSGAASGLRARLDEVDWAFVAQEVKTRLVVNDLFFRDELPHVTPPGEPPAGTSGQEVRQ